MTKNSNKEIYNESACSKRKNKLRKSQTLFQFKQKDGRKRILKKQNTLNVTYTKMNSFNKKRVQTSVLFKQIGVRFPSIKIVKKKFKFEGRSKANQKIQELLKYLNTVDKRHVFQNKSL